MSYRPRSRSRSPEYRQRRYSPSRPHSPPPHPHPSGSASLPVPVHGYARQDRWSPPPPRAATRGRAEDFYEPPPAPRRYDDLPQPPPSHSVPPSARGRYEDDHRVAPMAPMRQAPDQRYPPLPPRREYEDERYPPPPRNYEEERYVPPPRREYEDERYGGRDYDDGRSGSGRRDYDDREWNRRKYDDERYPTHAGMAADREEIRPRRDVDRTGPHWERGRDVDESDTYSGTHSPAAAEYPASSSNKRGPKGRNDPSRDVIFLGLDVELTETDFAGYLKVEHNADIDSVKIVRDKATGVSKGFGFAQFTSLDTASEFINNNYPAVLMPALYAHSDPRKVKIDFSATQAQSSHSMHEGGDSRGFIATPGHDGMRDIGSPGGGKRVLLLRGLNPTTPAREIIRRISQEIARMMGRIEREIAAESTIVRFAMIVDKNASSGWGYGFLELATAELASALLPFLLTPQHQPNGFVIDHMPVAASFANPGAFLPTPAGPLGGELVIQSSRYGGIGAETIDKPDGQWVAYWHSQARVVETLPNGAPRVSEDGKFDLTPEHRAFLGTLAGPPSSSANTEATGLASTQAVAPLVMGGLQPIKLGPAITKAKKKEEPAIIPIMTMNMLDDGEDVDLVGKDTVLLSRTKGIHIIPPTSSSRKIAKNISKWNTKQTELAAPEPVDPNAPPKGISDVNTTLGVRRPAAGPAPTLSAGVGEADQTLNQPIASGSGSSTFKPSNEEFDYTDITTLAATGKVACFLCQRQFKTEEVLRKHVGQSDLHKTNLLDANTREAGQRRKNAVSGNAAASLSAAELNAAKYRDRAAERRVAFNQPNAPIPEGAPVSAPQKRKFAEGPKAAPPTPPPAPVVEPGKDESNVGNQLLAKMGWKAGSGLGLGGEGRVDPVLVQQFENRAGLGASKGVEAGRWQGPGGFQQRALDMAKQRYNNSSSSSTPPGQGGGS